MRFGSELRTSTLGAVFCNERICKRKETAREARHITCALSIICAAFVYIHRVDRDNYQTFPAGSQPCALTF